MVILSLHTINAVLQVSWDASFSPVAILHQPVLGHQYDVARNIDKVRHSEAPHGHRIELDN